MKKLIFLVICLSFLFVATQAFAGPFDNEYADEAGYVNTAVVTSDASVIARPCYVYAVTFLAGAVGNSIVLYDGATAVGSGKIEIADGTANRTQRIEFTKPVKFETGVYGDIAGSSYAVIEYR